MEATETKIEHRLMDDEEKCEIMYQAALLFNKGKDKEATLLVKSVPLEPELAKIFKEVYGSNFLLECSFNLLEADEAYGKNWLYR
jgi:hypothetical protein